MSGSEMVWTVSVRHRRWTDVVAAEGDDARVMLLILGNGGHLDHVAVLILPRESRSGLLVEQLAVAILQASAPSEPERRTSSCLSAKIRSYGVAATSPQS